MEFFLIYKCFCEIKHLKKRYLQLFMAFKDGIRWVMQAVAGKDSSEIQHTDMRSLLLDTSQQFARGLHLGEKIVLENAMHVEHLTFVGMGGSMHPGFIFKTYLSNQGFKKPVYIVREYTIPQYISKRGFLFVISYSGNTEETIAAYREAYRQGYQMLVMTSGGKLKDLASKHGTQCIELPSGYPPRYSFYIMFGALLQVLQKSGMITDLEKETQHIDMVLRKPIFETLGKQLAEKIQQKLPLIYTTARLGSVAERWKICFNENAKVHAFWNVLPEMDHNEINAYATKRADFHALFLTDEDETLENAKRIRITKKLIQEHGYDATEIVVKGPSYLSRLLSAVSIGDWTSYNYALQSGVDPIPVEIIEKLKKRMKE